MLDGIGFIVFVFIEGLVRGLLHSHLIDFEVLSMYGDAVPAVEKVNLSYFRFFIIIRPVYFLLSIF